jgi:histidinol-phosphate/aromatic aminotransferase/cobyric acid decarboxylase-like protein
VSLPAPGPHGGDGAAVAAALGVAPGDVLDLSASLCPVAPDPGPVVATHLDALGRYPNPKAATAALAGAMGVDPDLVVLTNGGAEAISLLGGLVGGSVVEPDFSLYPRGAGGRWRSNPNNPLGTLAGTGETAAVWDEAFWPLATGTWTRGDHLRGALVVGSLTKLLACPGLRVGYALCPTGDVAARLRAAQPAWAVNGLVAEGLADLLAPVDLPSWRDATAALRARLAALLRGHGMAVREGVGSWVLVDGAAGLRDRLLPAGVVVRDCTSFGMPGTVRIAVPPEAGLLRLAGALASPPLDSL